MTQVFDNLNKTLATALKKQNITTPTEIQQKVIPRILESKDLIVQSETGTGKTLAYLLPLFEKLDPLDKTMQAIILSPTHELAIQIQRQIELLAQNSDIKMKSAPIIGNVNIKRQIDQLKEKPQIIVGSAGRILELIQKKKISAHTIKTIVIDEADRLMDKNNIDSVKAVIKYTLKDRQLLMFSASISKETLAKGNEIMKEPEFVKGEAKVSIPETIEHISFLAEPRDKVDVLRKLIRIINPTKAIAFVNKNEDVDTVTAKLKYHKLNVESINGLNLKLERKRIMEDFRNGKLQVLIASDIAARGLDIEGVTHIFNFDIPEDSKEYLHRVGRTGRQGKTGVAVSIITKKELELIKTFKRELKIDIKPKSMFKGNIVDVRPPRK